ncbi:MAG: nucleoside-diphosphate sugar epimerase, partial [Rubrobacter sp.]|nr:nucleoside-diphosphate sugar epimerase [Rubrobacter sp.]
RDIAGVIGRHLELPVTAISPGEADGHFGWIGRFFSMDVLASSTLTRERMGWQPTHPALIPDLEEGHYFGD